MKPHLLAASVLSLVTTAFVLGGTTGDPPRQLQLTVQVRSQPDNQPIDRLGVLVAGEDSPTRKLTGADGAAVFPLTVPATKARLVVTISQFGEPETPEEMEQEIARYEEVTSTYSFRQYYIVPIPAGQDQFSLDIAARPAVRVTGRLVLPDGIGVGGVVTSSDSPVSVSAVTTDDGTFVVTGVPKAHDTDIYLATPGNSRIRVIHLLAAQTLMDVELGDVPAAESAGGTVRVQLTVTNLNAVPWTPSAKSRWVTVVSQDGRFVAKYPLGVESVATGSLTSSDLPTLPDGVYYAVAGPADWNRAATGLIRLTRDGRAADLDAAGVARFEVQGPGQLNVTVDAAASEQALFTLFAEQ